MPAVFSQGNAEDTGYETGSFDLVFSRILLHETREAATHKCHRLPCPRGIMVHSDAPQFDELGHYDQSLGDWDIRFIGEPYMGGYHVTKLEDEIQRAGFAAEATVRQFAPSQVVQRGYRVHETRTKGGCYFYAGVIKQISKDIV